MAVVPFGNAVIVPSKPDVLPTNPVVKAESVSEVPNTPAPALIVPLLSPAVQLPTSMFPAESRERPVSQVLELLLPSPLRNPHTPFEKSDSTEFW